MKVGVVIGRFQVPRLHSGHLYLLNHVARNSDKLFVILGSPLSYPTLVNPLSYQQREQMLLEELVEDANLYIAEVFDNPSDVKWSQNVDALVKDRFDGDEITLYGSRDSFLSHYSGIHKIEYVEPIDEDSGTAHRRAVLEYSGPSFRAGIIHAQMTRAPVVYPTVDVAIINKDEVLLGRKSDDPEGKYRFIGGFVDVKDLNYAAAIRREAREEAPNIAFDDLVYLGSTMIDDWRYRNTMDQIISTFFKAKYIYGHTGAGDDLDELKWFKLNKFYANLIDSHRFLGLLLANSIKVDT